MRRRPTTSLILLDRTLLSNQRESQRLSSYDRRQEREDRTCRAREALRGYAPRTTTDNVPAGRETKQTRTQTDNETKNQTASSWQEPCSKTQLVRGDMGDGLARRACARALQLHCVSFPYLYSISLLLHSSLSHELTSPSELIPLEFHLSISSSPPPPSST